MSFNYNFDGNDDDVDDNDDIDDIDDNDDIDDKDDVDSDNSVSQVFFCRSDGNQCNDDNEDENVNADDGNVC